MTSNEAAGGRRDIGRGKWLLDVRTNNQGASLTMSHASNASTERSESRREPGATPPIPPTGDTARIQRDMPLQRELIDWSIPQTAGIWQFGDPNPSPEIEVLPLQLALDAGTDGHPEGRRARAEGVLAELEFSVLGRLCQEFSGPAAPRTTPFTSTLAPCPKPSLATGAARNASN